MQHGADTSFVPSQWETALLCNDVSHWLGTILESALQHNTAISLMTADFYLPNHDGVLSWRCFPHQWHQGPVMRSFVLFCRYIERAVEQPVGFVYDLRGRNTHVTPILQLVKHFCNGKMCYCFDSFHWRKCSQNISSVSMNLVIIATPGRSCWIDGCDRTIWYGLLWSDTCCYGDTQGTGDALEADSWMPPV